MSATRQSTKVGNSYSRTRTRSKAPAKKEHTKITNYFSPNNKSQNISSVNTGNDHLSNGSVLHLDAHDVVSSEFNNTLVLSSPNKKDVKLQNGYTPADRILPTICTRSQSQKLMSNCVSQDESPVKEPRIHSNYVSKDSDVDLASYSFCSHVNKNLKTPPSSPTQKESPVDGSTNSSPHTGPPTPHKIQALNEAKLRLDSPLSPSAISKLKIISPKKLQFANQGSNAKRKLPNQNNVISTNNSSENCKIPEKSIKPTVNGALKSNQKPATKNTQMTQFFPIRRSHRKPKAALLQEKQKEIEEKILSGKEEGLEVECFGSKGRGVKTTRHFRKGEMVVEYVGDLIDVKEAKEREKKYSLDTSKGCYMYYFTFQNTQYCIDATEESCYLGRLVNHSRNGNLATKAVEVNGKPHLILMAKKDLEAGTEILYDYGDRSKQSLEHHPWLAL